MRFTLPQPVVAGIQAVCLVGPIIWASSVQTQTAQAAPPESTLHKIRATGVISISYRNDAVPFSYIDSDKKPIGYTIDLCNEILNNIKRELKMPVLKVEYVASTAANRLQLIESGKVDLECGMTVNNPERRKKVGFSMPYHFSGPRLLTKSDSGINHVYDLSSKKVVVVKGSTSVPFLRNLIDTGRLQNTELVQTDTPQQAVELLDRGEGQALAALDHLLYAYRSTSRNPSQYEVVGGFFILEALALVFRKDDTEFKRVIDRQLAGLMVDGVTKKLYTKWFQSPVPPDGRVIGVPMSAIVRDQMAWPVDTTGDENNKTQ